MPFEAAIFVLKKMNYNLLDFVALDQLQYETEDPILKEALEVYLTENENQVIAAYAEEVPYAD